MSSNGDRGGFEISNEELLDELNRLANSLEKTPSIKEMDEMGKYSGTTYRTRFGTWNEAVLAAGLEPNAEEYNLSDTDLMESLKEFALKLGHTPTQKEMRQEGPHASSTYVTRFGTWNEAVQEAGLEPNIQHSKLSDEDLLNELKRVTEIFGKIPTQGQFEEESDISISTYYNHFDAWEVAIKRCDFEDDYDTPSEFEISTTDLLDEIKYLTSVLGRAPTITEMDELGAYSERTYRRRFESWKRSLEKANVNDNEQTRDKTQITEQELLAALRTLADELGRPPSFEDMHDHGKYGAATYLYRFGSWNQALRAARLQPRPVRSDQIPERDLIIELRRLAGELGHLPQRKEMEDLGAYSGMTYYNRFGSWNDSLDKAGFQKELSKDNPSLMARCFTCAKSIVTPINNITNTGSVFCDNNCRLTWEEVESIQLEGLIEEFYGENRDIRVIFVEALSTEILVAEVLVCLRLAINISSTTIDSAVSGDYRIENRKSDIAVIRLSTENNNQLLISQEAAHQLHEAMIEQSNASSHIPNLREAGN